MDSHLWFQQLHKALRDHRVPTRYASRFKEELWFHYLDMAERDEMNGFKETESHIFERLGSPETLAAQAAQVPRSTWVGRHPWLTFVVGAPLITLCLLFTTFLFVPFSGGTASEPDSWHGLSMLLLGPIQVIASATTASFLMCRGVRKSSRSPWWGVASCGLVALICSTTVIHWLPSPSVTGTGTIQVGLGLPVSNIWHQTLVPLVIGFVYAIKNLPPRKPQRNEIASIRVPTAA